jgi:hypothetical protein
MAARDEWSIPLKCPNCKREGEITFSEDDHPYMKGDSLRIDSISEGFKVRNYGRTSGSTEVECSDCKELAK